MTQRKLQRFAGSEQSGGRNAGPFELRAGDDKISTSVTASGAMITV
jgi:hypothetical protein